MRSIHLALFVLLTLIGSAPAAAADSDVLKQFGMLGRIAVDCAAPASRNNPYVIFAVSPQGNVTRTLKMDPSIDGTFPVRNVRLLAPDRLQYDETGRQSELSTTLVKVAGKIRSWRSVRTSGPEKGTVLIADGKFPKSGTPTIAFDSCRN